MARALRTELEPFPGNPFVTPRCDFTTVNITPFIRVAQLPLAPLEALGWAESVGASRAAVEFDDIHACG